MYKFFGEPLKEIKGRESGKVIFRFDHKGEFITDDPEWISRSIGHFDHIELKAEEVGERVKRTIITPAIKITTADDEKFVCKYCGEAFESFGMRQKHYMQGCPKKGE